MLIEITAIVALAMQDTTVIRPAAPVWGDNVAAVRELRIGTVEGAPEYTFGRLAAVAVTAGGHMLGLDVQASTVREYDAAGRYVRSFGRRGHGPGELDRPETIVVAGGRLIVRDPGNTRFGVFQLDGASPPTSWRYETTSFGVAAMTAHADGSIANALRIRIGGEYKPFVVRYRPDGTTRDTLAPPRLAYEAPQLVVTTDGGQARYSIPFIPTETWTYLRDGRFAGGLPNRPAFLVVGGDRVTRVDRVAARVPVPNELRTQGKQRLVQHLRRSNDPNYTWSGPDIPATKPYFSTIHLDAEDRLWVRVAAPSRRERPAVANEPALFVEPVHYEVYDKNLRFLGRVRMPDTFIFGDARGYHVWGIESDEFDVQYIVRYRLHMGQRR
jgi:hypothetical protein